MHSNSGQSTSIWMEVEVPTFAPLTSDMRTEVCIMGADIAGLTTAYLLGLAGKLVVVLGDGLIGGGKLTWPLLWTGSLQRASRNCLKGASMSLRSLALTAA